MEVSRGKLIRRVIVRVLIILVCGYVFIDAAVTDYYRTTFTDAVAYDSQKRGHYEKNDEYYMFAGTVIPFIGQFRGAIIMTNIYYDEEHPALEVSLDVYGNKLGQFEYRLGFVDPADDTNFGIGFDVDKSLHYISDNEHSPEDVEFAQFMMDKYRDTLTRLVEIANERWDLGLTVPYEWTLPKVKVDLEGANEENQDDHSGNSAGFGLCASE